MQQFLIHKIGELYVAVPISGIGLKADTTGYCPKGAWAMLEHHFLERGATKEALAIAKDQVEKNGTTSAEVSPISTR